MTEEEKPKEEKFRSPQLWLGLIIAFAVLILVVSFWKPTSEESITESVATKGFPLTLWLIIAGGFLLFRAAREFYSAWTSGKSDVQWISFNMLSVALGLLTIMILFLEGFCPDWWGNLLGSSAGKPLLLALAVVALLWYILPGTGQTTMKLGKALTTIAGVVILLMLLGTATKSSLPSLPERGFVPPAQAYIPPAPVPAAAPTPKWEIVAKQYVTYDHWDPEEFGFSHLISKELPFGMYQIEVVQSDFERYVIRDGKPDWERVPPEGLIGRYVSYQDKLALPLSRIGTRIMKINNEDPIEIGKERKFRREIEGLVKIAVSPNTLQDKSDGDYHPKHNFIHNKGGDWIVLKRLVTT